MIEKYMVMTRSLLRTFNDIQLEQCARLEELEPYKGRKLKCVIRASGRKYYYDVSKKDPSGILNRRYIGTSDSDEVIKIQERRYLEKSLSVLDKNIKILGCVVRGLQDTDFSSIDEMLPKTYSQAILNKAETRNHAAAEWKRRAEEYKLGFRIPYPERLIHKTDDGTMVRSKSEAIIYNLLLKMGVTFVYELPLKTQTRTFLPDFTILSEVDYESVILLEHQGMMEQEEYRENFKNRVYDYLCEGYMQGVNIFYTFDRIDGGINMDPVCDIIKMKIRPETGLSEEVPNPVKRGARSATARA